MSTLKQQRLTELKRLEALELKARAASSARTKQAIGDSEYRRKARAQQLPPEGDWRIWLIMAGRGFGKTWTGSRWLLEQALINDGTEWFIAAPTFGALKRVCFEGPSGILQALDPGMRQGYNRSDLILTLTNGSKIIGLSAEKPDGALGLNLSGGWADELAAWPYDEMWTRGISPALRIGDPKVVITTTPRPVPLIKEFTARDDGSVVITRGSTFDNAGNLSPAALQELRQRYEGTRLGRQELYGELLLDTPGALWRATDIESTRISSDKLPEMVRIVVAIDPAVTSGETSDETGIVIVGKGIDGRGYVLGDRSCRDTPSGWAHRAVQAFEDFNADRIVAEKNQGGDMVEMTIRSVMPSAPYKGVSARTGKRLRAEPQAALYEQGRVSHVGMFEQLEDQMTTWLPDSGTSPDRLDALVHGLAELGLAAGSSADRFFQQLAPPCDTCGLPVAQGSTNCPHCGARNETPDLTQIYPR